jgi:hypothetical protein
VSPNLLERHDLHQKIERTVCALGRAPSTREVWNQEVYDAQVEGLIVQARGSRSIEVPDLQRLASRVAGKRNHFGMATGKCLDGSAWVITAPSPEPLLRIDGDTLVLSDRHLGRHCKELRFDYAAAAGGAPRQIRRVTRFDGNQSLRISLNLLDDGALSISCLPTHPSWQGPQLWYLAPVKRGPPSQAPFVEVLKKANLSDAARLRAWINAIRGNAGLARLGRGSPAVMAAAQNLAKSQSLTHNRIELKKAGDLLKRVGGQVVGENRVKGLSLTDMAWLLWTSPRHRGLLLDPQSTELGISLREAEGPRFAVMVLARIPPK